MLTTPSTPRGTLCRSERVREAVPEESTYTHADTAPLRDYFDLANKSGENRFATHLIRLMLAKFAHRFDFELIDTEWDRDVKVVREALLTASAHGSEGVKIKLVDERH